MTPLKTAWPLRVASAMTGGSEYLVYLLAQQLLKLGHEGLGQYLGAVSQACSYVEVFELPSVTMDADLQ